MARLDMESGLKTGRVLGHVTNMSTGTSGNVRTTSYTYVPVELPLRPLRGSVVHELACAACPNTYRVRIDSVARKRLWNAVMWVVFPALTLLSMTLPGLLGAPDSWIIYFAAAVLAWIFFRRWYGRSGVSRPKRVAKVAEKWADHRVFPLPRQG